MFGSFALEVGLDGLVLRVEVGHIYDQVLEDEHVAQRSDECWFAEIGVDFPDAGQCVQPVAVHRAGPADAFPAGAPEGQSGVEVVLDVQQRIEVHRRDLLEINVVAHILGLVIRIFRVVLVDEETLHCGPFLGSQLGVVFDDVVGVEIALDGGSDAFKEDGGLVVGDGRVVLA